jgi:hypothetical protein
MHTWESGPEDFTPEGAFLPIHEVVGSPIYPNLAERVLRMVLHVVGIVALVLVSLLMLVLLRLGTQIGSAVDRVNSPDPGTTGCPFGNGECGG